MFLDYEKLKTLIKRGYSIRESCIRMSVSRSYIDKNLTIEQKNELKKLKNERV